MTPAGVSEEWHHGGDALGTGAARGVDHDHRSFFPPPVILKRWDMGRSAYFKRGEIFSAI